MHSHLYHTYMFKCRLRKADNALRSLLLLPLQSQRNVRNTAIIIVAVCRSSLGWPVPQQKVIVCYRKFLFISHAQNSFSHPSFFPFSIIKQQIEFTKSGCDRVREGRVLRRLSRFKYILLRLTHVYCFFRTLSSSFSIRYDTRATVDERKVFTSTMAWDFYERDSTTSPLSNFDATKDSW